MAETMSDALPAVPYIKRSADGTPYLEGHKCGACGAIFLGERSVCSKCTARDRMSPVRLADRGELYSFTIVHRSYPGIEAPFVSAVVDLDGGGAVKGNLINVAPTPDAIKPGMKVEVVFDDAGRTDDDGNRYIAFFFQPAGM